jgi:hypothetical protein
MAKMPRRGVVYAVAPSPLNASLLWAGTDDGLLWRVDSVVPGRKAVCTNVTPGLRSWAKVSQIDAGHFDQGTAYVAVNGIRLDDQAPHIFRTHDSGKTWKEIVNGLPNDPINTVREDPVRKGLLYAGSERAVYFSIDDGENWNPLRLNMPATSIRDLVVKDNDLVVGTHGRSFWILDDISPLRELQPAMQDGLVTPATTYRFRRDTYTDTPLPPEEPAGKNPPDGVILNYYLAHDAAGPVALEIRDAQNNLVRRYSSDDTPPQPKEGDLDVPLYWIRPPQVPSKSAGSHRFVWDMFWQPLGYVPYYPISAIVGDTPSYPTSPLAQPGRYTASLVVDGRSYSRSFELKMDPRVKMSGKDVAMQFEIAKACYDDLQYLGSAAKQVQALRDKAKAASKADVEAEAGSLLGSGAPRRRRRGAAASAELTIGSVQDELSGVMNAVEQADAPVTQQTRLNYQAALGHFRVLRKSIDDLIASAASAGIK